MINKDRLALLSLCSIGMALFLLIHMILILMYGHVIIVEDSYVVIAIEVSMLIGIILFSYSFIVEYLNSHRGRK